MHTTPRLALQIPDGTEAEDNFPTEDAATLAILDNAGLWQYGTLAAKPSASSTIPGTQYYCTDTTALLLCVGGQWVWPQASTEQVGTIKAFAGSTIGADPDGVQRWHICDGSTFSRTANATLYSVIGTAWGAGDGSTTANYPDLRGRSILGVGAGAGLTAHALASTGGAENLQAHTHGVTDPGHTHGVADPGHGHGIFPSTTNNPAGGPGSASAQWTFGAMEYVATVYTSLYGGNTNNVGTGIGIYGATTGLSVQSAGAGTGQNWHPFAAAQHIIKIA